MKKETRQSYGYAATSIAFPQYTIYSWYHWKMKDELLSLLINPCPSHAEGFIARSMNTSLDKQERLKIIWPLFCKFDPKDEADPENGQLRITDKQIKGAINDHYLFQNLKLSDGTVYPVVDGYFIVICKTPTSWMVSKPIKLTDMAIWFKHPSNGYDAPKHVAHYVATKEDTRKVLPGHLFNMLHSTGTVYQDTDNTTVYPFDLTSPEERNRVKFTDKYIYPRATIIKLEAMETLLRSSQKQLNVHAGLYGCEQDQTKRLSTIVMPHDYRRKIYTELSAIGSDKVKDCIQHIKTNHSGFKLFPSYEWGRVPSLSNTFKGLL